MKKFLMTLLCLGIICTTAPKLLVSAADVDTQPDGPIIETRYQEINHITAYTSIEKDIVFASGTYRVRSEEPNIKLRITVQESANGTVWEDVKTTTFKGTVAVGDATILYAPVDRHFYRTKVVLEVYDPDGNFIESGHVESNVILYSE